MEDEPINQNYLIGCDTIENSPSLSLLWQGAWPGAEGGCTHGHTAWHGAVHGAHAVDTRGTARSRGVQGA